MADRHFLDGISWPLRVSLIGCGGNGAQMLTGLAALELALNAIGNRSLEVTTYDPDTVSTANLGRQPFFPADVGRHKAIVLTERINLAYGLDWHAIPARFDPVEHRPPGDLIISCVDTAAARRDIHRSITRGRGWYPAYWLDLGNRAEDGQIVLGSAGKDTTQPRLPNVIDRFPELADPDLAEDDAPSCSLAEALERQSLFVNRTIASHALALLSELLLKGSIGRAGNYVNLATGICMPIALPPRPIPVPARRSRRKHASVCGG